MDKIATLYVENLEYGVVEYHTLMNGVLWVQDMQGIKRAFSSAVKWSLVQEPEKGKE